MTAVHGGDNTFFEEQKTAGNLPRLVGSFTGSGLRVPYAGPADKIRVKLWRSSRAGSWYEVDELEVDTRGANPGDEWYVNVRRDTAWEPYLGAWPDATPRPARWRMVVGFPPTDPGYGGGPLMTMAPDQALLRQLGTPFDANGLVNRSSR